LNKFLNTKPTYDKHKVRAVVKEVLTDMKPSTPQPQPIPQSKYQTPMKISRILGTLSSPPSPPPPPVKPQTPYHTADSDNEDDDDDYKPSPRAAALKRFNNFKICERR